MARKVEIEVEIGADGQVQFHVHGKKGKACLEVMESMQQALGPVTSHTLTSEYYETASVEAAQQIHKGRKQE